MVRDREESSEEEEASQRWMDRQIKQREQPLNRRLSSWGRRVVKGNRFASEPLKRIHTKEDGGRMEVEDSGCQDWRWDRVRSHFSSVIALSVSPPLSCLTNYGTMRQTCSCRAACGSLIVKQPRSRNVV